MLLIAREDAWLDIESTKRSVREIRHVEDWLCNSSDYTRRDASLVTGHPHERRSESARAVQSDRTGRPTAQYVVRRANVLSSQFDRQIRMPFQVRMATDRAQDRQELGKFGPIEAGQLRKVVFVFALSSWASRAGGTTASNRPRTIASRCCLFMTRGPCFSSPTLTKFGTLPQWR